MDLIIYHKSCPDGWAAAYIAKKRYPEAELMPRDHGVEPPYKEVENKDVLVVDFSWRTRQQNDELAGLAKSFRILDHHKSAQEILAGAPYAVFDMKRSGAGLAWDYLFGVDSPDAVRQQYDYHKPRPWFIDYVEDRDLWKFVLPESKKVNAFIMTFPYTIEAWDKLADATFHYAVTAGENILLEIDKYIREVIKQAQYGVLNIGGKHYSVAVVNVPYIHTSDIGNELSKACDIGLGWFERADGQIQFSARSQNDIDVSAVAKHFNGGGHLHAAGWQLPLDKGREVIDNILGRKQ